MWFFLLCQTAFLVLAVPSPSQPRTNTIEKPPAFFLAGDSTTAVQSTGGGGWGTGFLGTLSSGAIGTNFGHNGATTVSFLKGGDWTKVLDAVKKNQGSYNPYVTIQFGHNDQKASSNITVAQYKTNLANFANDVVSAGGTPILVTPLSRRKFSASGTIIPDLADQVTATMAVASSIGAAYIDLNGASMKYLNSIGEANARQYDLKAGDETHLNEEGSVVFGNMVAGLILGSNVAAEVKGFLTENTTIAAAISVGKFIFP